MRDFVSVGALLRRFPAHVEPYRLQPRLVPKAAAVVIYDRRGLRLAGPKPEPTSSSAMTSVSLTHTAYRRAVRPRAPGGVTVGVAEFFGIEFRVAK